MTRFALRLAAALTLAALPMAGAHAAQPIAIKVNDLDLTRTEDMAIFQARAQRAENALCRTTPDLGPAAACRAAVREEINQKLSVARDAQLAQRRAATLAAR